MSRFPRARARPDDEGFTLIELMVVVLIIAILIAIAIPTFLGAQNRARDRAAQSDLRNALTTAKTISTDHQGYFLNIAGTKLVAADMPEGEPALNFDDTTTSSSNPRTVFINDATDGSVITFVQRSASGLYFGVSVGVDGLVTYCRSTVFGDCDDGTLDAANYIDTW
jgi:type IV pilus assembly protein PilA